MDFILNASTVLVPLAIGICLLTQARRIQEWAIRVRQREDLKLFDSYVKSKTYVVVVRLTGAMSIIVAFLLFYAIAKM